jgi:hypothetical protein
MTGGPFGHPGGKPHRNCISSAPLSARVGGVLVKRGGCLNECVAGLLNAGSEVSTEAASTSPKPSPWFGALPLSCREQPFG